LSHAARGRRFRLDDAAAEFPVFSMHPTCLKSSLAQSPGL
jgi:hypothetical protein